MIAVRLRPVHRRIDLVEAIRSLERQQLHAHLHAGGCRGAAGGDLGHPQVVVADEAGAALADLDEHTARRWRAGLAFLGGGLLRRGCSRCFLLLRPGLRRGSLPLPLSRRCLGLHPLRLRLARRLSPAGSNALSQTRVR